MKEQDKMKLGVEEPPTQYQMTNTRREWTWGAWEVQGNGQEQA